MDKDKIVGAILGLGLLGSYIFYNRNYHNNKTDKVAVVTTNTKDKTIKKKSAIDSEVLYKNNFFSDKFITKDSSQKFSIENDDVKIIFDTNGGRIHNVFLKNNFNYQGFPIQLISEDTHTGFKFKCLNTEINTNDLIFDIDKENSDKKNITFFCDLGNGKIIKQSYSLEEKGFEVKHYWNFINSNKYFDNNVINFFWEGSSLRQENDRDYCQKRTTINYLTSEDKFNGLNEVTTKDQNETLSSLKWIALKQRFFTIGIDSSDHFKDVKLSLMTNANPDHLKNNSINASILDVNSRAKDEIRGLIRYYFGPNDYKLLKDFAYKFDKNLYLGFPVVRQINEYLFLPLLNFLHRYVNNIILLLFLLVLIVKLLLFPLGFRSYKSMMEMRLLNPALTALQEKYKNEPEIFQLEQMKLYREMGIQPLGGCLPMLLQWPVFVAMFTLIPNVWIFRHKSFMWVKDWSSYDNILNLPFSIPFYGNHVSLFALLMTISTILFSIVNNSTMPMNPQMKSQMKFMNYFLPITFLFIMNSLPAALTLYYFFSNMIQIIQQYLIGRFIDEEKIKDKLEARRIKKVGENSFNQKIQQIIDFQKKSK